MHLTPLVIPIKPRVFIPAESESQQAWVPM